MIIFMNFLFMIIMILISVAFLTLLERKILSYMQNRKGPNKVGFKGILQPFSDAIKLLSKEWFFLNLNYLIFLMSPMMMFLFSIMLWILYPWSNIIKLENSFILLIFLLSINVFPVIFIGWISNNNYSMLGSLRALAQMISFEISLFLMFFLLMMLLESYSMISTFKMQNSIKFFILLLPIYLIFFISMLIELNRTPFDLIEGESELVSGFNVEYYSSFFILIFLSEYANIVFTSLMLTMIFYGFNFYGLKFLIIMMIHMITILWIRGVLPRIRYDNLMKMCWIDFLLISLFYTTYIYLMKEFLFNLS